MQLQIQTSETVAELKQAEVWAKWCNQERRRLIGELAILKVELEEARRVAGKAIAENAVVSDLTIAAKQVAARKELGSIVEKIFDANLHFLANNVRNQDI